MKTNFVTGISCTIIEEGGCCIGAGKHLMTLITYLWIWDNEVWVVDFVYFQPAWNFTRILLRAQKQGNIYDHTLI